MIGFVEAKVPDYTFVRSVLSGSEETGMWSNFGPASLRLEAAIADGLHLPADRRAIACASGTAALHALVALYEHEAGTALRWVVCAFTFAAQRQGPLARATVVDCDEGGRLDLDALRALPPESYDGVIVTDLFGVPCDAEPYERFAAEARKVLLFDAATCFGSSLGRRGDGEAFSFHHTKPCGFGEGGCAVVPARLEDAFRSVINFGLYKDIDTGARSCNAKMSDVAAAFILDRLRRAGDIAAAHRAALARYQRAAHAHGLTLLGAGGDRHFPSLAPVLARSAITLDKLPGLPVVVHKYYRPLEPLPQAANAFARIVCFPCHPGTTHLSDDELSSMLAPLAR